MLTELEYGVGVFIICGRLHSVNGILLIRDELNGSVERQLEEGTCVTHHLIKHRNVVDITFFF